ncbi:UDP-galactopyranose mutase [Campylobacter jejuni]|uniref:UDP-galactopyranose mutase n=2 Tax=Campylobacter jejuni TaxID=197 RepID=A0A0U2RG40_CAMJU|nr:UDP-galactopyranose mutase [Campylobacter jejuni]AJK71603.1 UDP-galactopyranose mutase [Campylobacter jejuni subsp. jejuni]ALT31903.1 UDP-galactopyranose mutase [Campylobacter jejuni subsp. jejuni]EAB5244273.1 UDP-galactopyranose mutase [Campylobacter jejuni]EAH4618457.1 UDP-galactopyranose mutase [Campylobacter jejuni]EAH5767460.1 UDP-galactopyranose mutase [Campylobacter jejuni]
MYDYLIIGSGLFGSIFAYEASKKGYKCLVLEKRSHIGGNCYTENTENINIHKYGAHIFRTSDYDIWKYMQQFCKFNHFINSPIANFKGEIYNLPFNMNTFSKLWGIFSPEEAKNIINKQSQEIQGKPKNLEEHVIKLVGRDVYEKFVKGYTEKQWGRDCKDLPASIIRRIPVRYIYDNNYFNDPYQGIPIGGYTAIFEKMLTNCEVLLNVDFLKHKEEFQNKARKIIFTGTIDSFYDYQYGTLEYRSLKFEHKILDTDNYQGVAVVNYTDKETPYTRTIEHKHFEFGKQEKTVVSEEYPLEWSKNMEPYYPINDDKNQALYERYLNLAKKETKIYFGGRLGEYKYYDMQDSVKSALEFSKKELKGL